MQQLAHYRIEELLGEGTFAWVYRAMDRLMGITSGITPSPAAISSAAELGS